jgi:hypothetical protein
MERSDLYLRVVKPLDIFRGTEEKKATPHRGSQFPGQIKNSAFSKFKTAWR